HRLRSGGRWPVTDRTLHRALYVADRATGVRGEGGARASIPVRAVLALLATCPHRPQRHFLPNGDSVMHRTNALPPLVAAALSCQPAPPPDTSAEAKKAIDAANGTWASLTAGGHAD